MHLKITLCPRNPYQPLRVRLRTSEACMEHVYAGTCNKEHTPLKNFTQVLEGWLPYRKSATRHQFTRLPYRMSL